MVGQIMQLGSEEGFCGFGEADVKTWCSRVLRASNLVAGNARVPAALWTRQQNFEVVF